MKKSLDGATTHGEEHPQDIRRRSGRTAAISNSRSPRIRCVRPKESDQLVSAKMQS